MHVVYQWDTGSNKLVRWQVQEDEVSSLPEPLPVDAESVELLRPSANLCTFVHSRSRRTAYCCPQRPASSSWPWEANDDENGDFRSFPGYTMLLRGCA